MAATGVQTQGVLDDVYAGAARKAALGPVFDAHGTPTLSVWAPTAHSVVLDIGGRTVAMREDTGSGVWSVRGARDWTGQPYLFEVTVWAPSVQKLVDNKVTDPYSVALTADSKQSLLADLDDPRLAPAGWARQHKPPAAPMQPGADPGAAHPGLLGRRHHRPGGATAARTRPSPTGRRPA